MPSFSMISLKNTKLRRKFRKIYCCHGIERQQDCNVLFRKVAEAGDKCRGGDSLNEDKEIHKVICGCNVTLTFKGNNPDIKKIILDMLCDSFEERVMREARANTDKADL